VPSHLTIPHLSRAICSYLSNNTARRATISYAAYTGITLLDADGDGQLSADDLAIYWNKAKAVLSHAVPSSAGFASGMALGLLYA